MSTLSEEYNLFLLRARASRTAHILTVSGGHLSSACLGAWLWSVSWKGPFPSLEGFDCLQVNGVLAESFLLLGGSQRPGTLSAVVSEPAGSLGRHVKAEDLAQSVRSWLRALESMRSGSTVPRGKSFCVLTKGGKEAANDLSNPQITFLRHSRPVLGALCFQLGITQGLCKGLDALF